MRQFMLTAFAGLALSGLAVANITVTPTPVVTGGSDWTWSYDLALSGDQTATSTVPVAVAAVRLPRSAGRLRQNSAQISSSSGATHSSGIPRIRSIIRPTLSESPGVKGRSRTRDGSGRRIRGVRLMG